MLIAGCCHCGIVNILARLAELEPEPPDAVIGGFHLAVPGTGELDEALVDGVAARLLALPGIGPATAAGVVAFAYQRPAVYL